MWRPQCRLSARHHADASNRISAAHYPASLLAGQVASRLLAPTHFRMWMPQASCNKQLFEFWIALDKSPHLIVSESAGLRAHALPSQLRHAILEMNGDAQMEWFIGIAVLVIIGLSVVVGKALDKPKIAPSERRQSQITALKASGALKHRKSNRD